MSQILSCFKKIILIASLYEATGGWLVGEA